MGLKQNNNGLPGLGLWKKQTVIPGLLLLAIIGCGATFSYRHYGLDARSYDGSLLGPDPKQDLPLKVCEPDAVSTGKCMVMLAAEFYRLKADYLDMANRLIACERKLATGK